MSSEVPIKQICQAYLKGQSALVISKQSKLPPSRIYRVLKNEGVPRRTLAEVNRQRFAQSPLSFRFKKQLSIKEKQLLAAAIMLYCGEGAKTNSNVDFANSNPRTIKVFLKFLRSICQVDENRLRFYLYCFADQSPKKLIHFWSHELHVSKDQFTKPYVRQKLRQHNRVMPYGVLHVRYSDKRLLEKILGLVNTITDELIQTT